MFVSSIRRVAAAALCVAGLVVSPAVAQTPAEAIAAEGTPPPGANDTSCRPSAAHPEPVVLVHGTFEDMLQNWVTLSPVLKSAGYCVFALNYGDRGTARIETSSRELADFVSHVRSVTGARRVALVGHSQGGMMPRHYIKFLGGDRVVSELVGLVPSNHGTTNLGAFLIGGTGLCDACLQQVAGSAFLRRLNSGDETPGRVHYCIIREVRYACSGTDE
jgi:triacylglycerol lipase